MDTRILPGASRLDVVTTDTAPRVAPASSPPFRDLLARGASAVVRGAEAAISSLPGAPIVAAAVRGGQSGSAMSGIQPSMQTASLPAGQGLSTSLGSAESPLPTSAAGAGTSQESGSVEQTLAQSQEFNLYYLQLQEQLAAENRTFSAMSNVLKTRHDTVKNAIGNIR